MTVIVNACSAFGLTVSETKTEIMSPQTKYVGTRCQCSRPGTQTNDQVCVFGRGYQCR